MVQLSFSLACAQPVEAELHFAECIVSQLKPAFFSLWQLLPQPVELHVHFADANKGVAFSQFTRFPAGVSSSPGDSLSEGVLKPNTSWVSMWEER